MYKSSEIIDVQISFLRLQPTPSGTASVPAGFSFPFDVTVSDTLISNKKHRFSESSVELSPRYAGNHQSEFFLTY